jgi:hypothetical protein
MSQSLLTDLLRSMASWRGWVRVSAALRGEDPRKGQLGLGYAWAGKKGGGVLPQEAAWPGGAGGADVGLVDAHRGQRTLLR